MSHGATRILPLDLGSFTFADDDPHLEGQTGVTVAYLVEHPDGLFLFDNGFGSGNAELDALYHPRPRTLEDALADVGHRVADVAAAANCHLHVDHSGQNVALAGIPIYVQRAEWELAHRNPDHTIL